jgi:RES domain
MRLEQSMSSVKEFASHRSYHDFATAVRQQRRYVLDDQQQQFLATVLATSSAREQGLTTDSNFWRAQLGCDWMPYEQDGVRIAEVPSPFCPGRMLPLRDRAKEGRANPKGIPYLYGASHTETAIAEVRPWIGAHVSVGQFRLTRAVRLVNCSTDARAFRPYFEKPSPAECERAVWRDIDHAYSAPVTRSDDLASFVPTQILAEFFLSSGFDGIAYRSSLGPGHNLVLFDLAVAELVRCTVYAIKKVEFTAEPDDAPSGSYAATAMASRKPP